MDFLDNSTTNLPCAITERRFSELLSRNVHQRGGALSSCIQTIQNRAKRILLEGQTHIKVKGIEHDKENNVIINIITRACGNNPLYASKWFIKTDSGLNRHWIQIVRQGASIPEQGWKIHISAASCSALEILQRVLFILLAEDANFKIAASLEKLDYLNQGKGGLSQIGKFITVYANDNAQAVFLASLLHNATKGKELRYPDIPSDRQLSLGSLIYYRYGSFGNQLVQTPEGNIIPSIRAANGQLVPDFRGTTYIAPNWTTDPFVEAGLSDELLEETLLINQRYLLLSIIHQSPYGGVYLGIDIISARTRIIKRARRDSGIDNYGRDTRDRLYHEAKILCDLAPNSSFPEPFDLIESNNDLFLVMQDMEGETLQQYISEIRTQGLFVACKQVVTWGRELASHLARIHKKGYIYRDLKSTNIIVGPASQLCLVDFELCHEFRAIAPPFGIGTRGYTSPQQQVGQVPTIADDIYGLGAILYFMITCAEPSLAPIPHNLFNLPPELLNPEIPASLKDLIARCLHYEPRERFASIESLDTALSTIEENLATVSVLFGSRQIIRRDTDLEWEFRDMAYELGKTICSVAESVPDGRGMTWSSSHDLCKGNRSIDLNTGTAGVVIALAELVSVRPSGNDCYLDTLAEGARWLKYAPYPGNVPLPGLYVGEAGRGAALLRAGQVLGDSELINSAVAIGHWVSLQDYASPDVFNGTAGRLFFHVLLYDETGESSHLKAAVKAGESLLAIAEAADEGELCWRIPPGYSSLSGFAFLGYAHGAAGISDVLLDLYEISNDERFLLAAQRAGRWLARLASPALEDGSGLNWPDCAGDSVSGAFWCRGAAGIGRFFLHASVLSILQDAGNIAERAARTVARVGRWNSPTQCHGLSGSIEFLLDMYQSTNNRAYMNEAWALASILRAYGVVHENNKVWPSESPTTYTPDYMVGYSGVLACMLRLSNPMHLPHLLSRSGFRRTAATWYQRE
jgi:serine/threonine protein kinase